MPNQISNEDKFLLMALERNRPMPTFPVTSAGQLVDIELDDVPGYAYELQLNCSLSLDVVAGASAVAPTESEFFPYNLFSNMQISLGGGAFQNVNPYFYYLREKIMGGSWEPGNQGPDTYGYQTNSVWSVPSTINTTSSSTATTTFLFSIRIPLQTQHGSILGHLPMGDGKTKVHLRATIASQLNGSDHYLNPTNGGTAITAVNISSGTASYIQPNIHYRTSPADGTVLQPPKIGYLLNVQEQVNPLSVSGSWQPVKFPNPFRYLRLWHVLINSSGAPNTSNVSGFGVYLTPGYAAREWGSTQAMQDYFQETARRYKTNLPTGVFVYDGWSGSDAKNPNGTQTIDGSKFSTLQTAVTVNGTFGTGSSAKVITYAEALAVVGF